MKLGKYDQKFQFVTWGKESDGAGGYNPVEIVELTTFAQINQLQQSSDLEQAQLLLPETYRVRMIVRNGFNPVVGKDVKWRGEIFKISTTPRVESVRLQKEWIFDIVRGNNG